MCFEAARTHLGLPKRRGFAGDDDVAHHRQLAAAAQRKAVDLQRVRAGEESAV